MKVDPHQAAVRIVLTSEKSQNPLVGSSRSFSGRWPWQGHYSMQSNQKRSVEKYIENSHELDLLRNFLSEDNTSLSSEYVIVIPAYDEKPDFLSCLTKHPHADKLLAIVVLNEPKESESSYLNGQLNVWLNENTRKVKETDYYCFAKLNFVGHT